MVRFAEHEAGFGDVWYDDVCLRTEFAHFECKFGGESCVEFAVVCHGRVYIDEGIFFAEEFKELFYDLDLFKGAEVSCVDGVEFDVFGEPVFGDGHDVVCKVTEGVVFESARVGG